MNTLKAEKRDLAVKAKRLRREGYVTGNIFGREVKGSIPIKIERKDVDRLLNCLLYTSPVNWMYRRSWISSDKNKRPVQEHFL